ncbi:N-6 DNA methylase [Caldalkalibacillus thermarum TA2.A1]|uniref:site-specific DNA-methyltransferase (adenine-specific) n=1 Tax=Caldalkalibacillus thermarum (strain TA2.A1) TaxID=986075 RepID=F5L897_CALTT|nr:TaqI-like C-terminal specificity domain-containing protein [Caldalkalibacillus thermarum]EGL82417.1 N-6 DNA methylase [Caldalkalibacillus thermarum TA2.A1]QZT35011.1 N-6 DNA methylase [Caldalkalibacillus thermarum TA2.A1]
MDKYLTLQQAADYLAVSPATVKNWVKTGLIRHMVFQNGQRMVARAEIDQLSRLIEQGELNRLRKRRNKRAVKGRLIPSEYVGFKPYAGLTAEIMQVADPFLRTATTQQATRYIRLILCECVLQLWRHKHGFHGQERDAFTPGSGTSLTAAWITGEVQPGWLSRLLTGLIHTDGLSPDEKELLDRLQPLDIPYVEGEDFLGLVYLSLSQLGQRKQYGQYYTPSSLVREMVESCLDQLEITEKVKIMDPCCGSGNFLLKLFQHLKSRLCALGFSVQEAEKHLFQSCLLGMDIDPVAVTLTKINLALAADHLPAEMPGFQIQVRDFLAQGTALQKKDAASFDVMIGNPPWGSTFGLSAKKELKTRFRSARYLVDSFSLFVEQAVRLLKPGGILNFVLPEAMLSVSGHRPVREFLLEQTQLLDIHLLGNTFTGVHSPVITFMAQRQSGEKKNHCVHVRGIGKGHRILQQRFKNNHACVFNVYCTDDDDRLLRYLRSHPAATCLQGKAAFALGIVTGNNQKFLVSQQQRDTEPILKGSDIFKYRARPAATHIRFQPDQFQQVAPLKYYRAKEKLIYRFINRTLVFAYDNQQHLTLNSANILVPETSELDIKYLLAVLNSKTIQYFYQLSFCSVKVLRRYLEAVPIPLASPNKQQFVAQLVDQLLSAERPSDRKAWYEDIEEEIMDLFELNSSQKRRINQTVAHIHYLDD